MKWEKTGKSKKGGLTYTASCDGEKTMFNLDGLKITQDFTSQEEAVNFLIVNGYEPFDIDGSSKASEEVEIPEEESEEEPEEEVAESVYDLKEEIANEVEEETGSACGLEEDCECEDDECEIEDDFEDDLEEDS